MADWNWDRFGDDDDDDAEEEGGYQKWQWGTRDGLIVLIDCSKQMFDNSGEESAFDLCIKCAKSVVQQKIISSDKDLLGIVFYATDKSSNPSDFKNVYILQDLGQPGADRVLQLEALIEEDDNDDFNGKYGHSNTYSLSDALWTCSNMFSNCSQKLGYKRVMLFTNEDHPHSSSAQLKRQAIAKAEDLHQNGISLELLHMNRPGHKFDVNIFYKDILYPDEDEDVVMPDPSEKFDELLTRVRRKDHKKRALSRMPFSLGAGLDMSIGVYNLVRPCTKPYGVKLYKKTNEEIKSVTKTFLTDTGEVLMPQDMKKSQTYAAKQICFEQEEVTEIKKFGTPGLKLMGFKPRNALKRYFHIKPAQFIYPDETQVQGSTSMFTAMLAKCLERDVIAICRHIPRRNTPPRFVALIPQEEELDEHNVQVVPPGFHLIVLPYADDFRKLKMDPELPRANADQITAAKKIIQKLELPFTPEQFDNPVLQNHYVAVEAMALDRDKPEEITDYTLPKHNKMQKRAQNEITEFKDLVFPDDYVPGAKRRGPAGGGAAKKAKIEDVDIDVEKEARAGKLSKLTVPLLKDCVKKLNIKGAGTKKADLIDAINNHFGL